MQRNQQTQSRLEALGSFFLLTAADKNTFLFLFRWPLAMHGVPTRVCARRQWVDSPDRATVHNGMSALPHSNEHSEKSNCRNRWTGTDQ